MELVEQLWLLKQVYTAENRYYSPENQALMYRVPLTGEERDALEAAGHLPNRMVSFSHDAMLDELRSLAAGWTLAEASDAFLAGLWSAPLLWRAALPAKLLVEAMPDHSHTPYGGSPDTCMVCGFRSRPTDAAWAWYHRMTGSLPLDGVPDGYVLALRDLEELGPRPVPTEYDLWVFRAILTVLRQAPPKTRGARLRDMLKKESLLPVSDQYVYGSLLEVLALMGILDTERYPGLATRFTTYAQRDQRPSVRVEAQAPLAWWDSSVGINEGTLKKLFPQVDGSPVDLTNRPEPAPPLAQTITGQLAKRRLPRRRKGGA